MEPSPSNDQDKIWRHFQNAASESFAAAHPRLLFLLDLIAARATGPKPRVLNIGIGDGFFERGAKGRGWEVTALDPDGEAVKRLVDEGIPAKAGLIEAMPFGDASFDFVVASEVIEHLHPEQRAAGLAEIQRVLAPRGWFLGTVPHHENLTEQQTVCPACGHLFHRWGHHASFTFDNIRELLAPQFDVDDLQRTAFVDIWGRGFVGFIKGILRVLLAKLGEPIAVPTIWWIARKSQ